MDPLCSYFNKKMSMPSRLLGLLNDIWSFLTTLFMAVLMLLTPIHNFVELVVLLITFDFITGIAASWKNHEKITARRMSKTVLKMLFYSVAIIVAYVLQMIANEGIGLPRIAALYIGATEVKSIYENISKIIGGDILSSLWSLIKSKIDEYISGISLNKGNNQTPEDQ